MTAPHSWVIVAPLCFALALAPWAWALAPFATIECQLLWDDQTNFAAPSAPGAALLAAPRADARPGAPPRALAPRGPPAGASGPDAKSGLRTQGAKRGVGSVAGSRGGAGRARGHPHIRKPACLISAAASSEELAAGG